MGKRSKVRRWAERAMAQCARTTRDDDPESLVHALAVLLIRSILRQDDGAKSSRDKMLSKVRRKYIGDSTSFELGIYAYFRLDLWHVERGLNECRNQVLYGRFVRLFIDTFEKEIGVRGLGEVFDNRLKLYGSLVRNPDPQERERIRFFLAQLLLRTAGDTVPLVHDFSSFPLLVSSIIDDMMMETEIGAFEAVMLPRIFSSVDELYRKIGASQ